MTHPDCILELSNISKDFPGVRVLDRVSLEVRAGTVHALIGENGAGKSTLMKILIGLYCDYDGAILRGGRRVTHGGVRDALASGISMIHQELTYVPDMTIAENLLLGREPASRVLGRIDRREALRQAETLLQKVGLALDPNRLMRHLSVAERQLVEIAKALSYDAEIIIMDEPTSALSQREVERLFAIVADLKAKDVTILYISHKLDEVFRIADEVTVLRDGRVIATSPIGQTTTDALVALMVGRELKEVFPQRAGRPGPEVLAVRHLTRQGAFRDVCFSLRRGEILGLAGLMGAGRTEVIRCLFGLDSYDEGQIRINGEAVTIRNPTDALRLGLGLVSEDRKVTGLIPCLSVGENITLSNLKRCSWGPVLLRTPERKLVEGTMRDLSIKAPSATAQVETLSGGNQQKVVLGKALLAEPDILILDEPTRGIDVGTKAEIYQLMRRLADEGKAILMVSSELSEIIGMSDRIVVLRDGQVTGQLDRGQANPERIMRYAITQ